MVERSLAYIFGTKFFQEMGFVQSNTKSNKFFAFRTNLNKANDQMFQLIPKKAFWATIPIFFPKKLNCHAKLYMGSYHYAKVLKKITLKINENLQSDKRMDRPYFIGPFGLLPGVQKESLLLHIF